MAYILDRFRQAPSYTPGRAGKRIEYITIHYWGVDGQKHQNIVNFFAGGPGTSAHEVISGGRVSPIVRASDTAWSNGNWLSNLVSYSLECRPEMSAADFDTVAERIADLWREWGRVVPLRPHDDFTSTSCPGPWKAQLPRLYARAAQFYQQGNPSGPATTPVDKPSIPVFAGGGDNQMFMLALRNGRGNGKVVYAVAGPGFWMEWEGDLDKASNINKQLAGAHNSPSLTLEGPAGVKFWNAAQKAARQGYGRI